MVTTIVPDARANEARTRTAPIGAPVAKWG